MADALKSCPFCGGAAEITHYEIDGYLPHCTKCEGMIETWFKSEAESITAWNRRVPEVVYCRDCVKYMTPKCLLCSFDVDGSCTGGPDADYYCGFGEPEENA